jgi:uncharacterized protein (DUF433 family)
MSWPDRIIVDPDVLAGKPVIRGTRLAVEFILDLLAAGQSEDAILSNYPGLTREDILACLAYASHLVPTIAALGQARMPPFWNSRNRIDEL